MLGSFKLRLLLVIIITAIVGLAMQSGHYSRQVVEPVLNYVMAENYDIGKFLSKSRYLLWEQDSERKALPSIGGIFLKTPCDYLEIERNFGWQPGSDSTQEEFCPGIYLRVKEKSAVKPILEGEVVKVEGDRVIIQHQHNLLSVYGWLQEILVKEKLAQDNLITISQLRDALNTSRKSAKPMLEYLDNMKITRKNGTESERVGY